MRVRDIFERPEYRTVVAMQAQNKALDRAAGLGNDPLTP
jgi:hypothetical protein